MAVGRSLLCSVFFSILFILTACLVFPNTPTYTAQSQCLHTTYLRLFLLGKGFTRDETLFHASRHLGLLPHKHQRGKRYLSSRLSYYSNTDACFQLTRLITSGDICPNPGPDLDYKTAGYMICWLSLIEHLMVTPLYILRIYSTSKILLTTYEANIFSMSPGLIPQPMAYILSVILLLNSGTRYLTHLEPLLRPMHLN